jgi:16S rRNA (cytosine967-C5)-methyltransferase
VTATIDRVAAAKAVGRVLREGAWSNVVARTEAAAAGADVSAVQGLVFAVLRMRPMIDSRISRHAHRPIDEIDPGVCDLLRVGMAELVDGRTPVPLVVDGTVHAVGRASPRAKGFANAVLRRLSKDRGGPDHLDDIGTPEFVDTAMRHVLDADDVDAFWWASQEPADVGLRVAEPIPGTRSVDGIPGARLLSGGSVPGGIAVQDPASVAVGNAVAASSGQTVLDMAAAPGGKARHLAEQVSPEGTVIAMDSHLRRVRDAAMRVPAARWVVGDGTAPPFVESIFDAVLVDAPCTGLGTLRRRPEIRERVTPEEMARLASMQRTMLEHALRLCRPGGRVVYSVCTVTPAETIDVVAGLGGRPPDGLPGLPFGDGWLMSPHRGPTDGMFLCVFEP